MPHAKLSVGMSARLAHPLRIGAFMALSLVTVATRAIAQQVDTVGQPSDSGTSPTVLKKLSVEELMNVVSGS
jgi:hypothetical protein